MNFYEMSVKEKIHFLLEQHNNPRRDSYYAIVVTPALLLGSLSLQTREYTNRLKDEEVLGIVKDMYCTFIHTGGYNRYHNLLATRRCSRFQSISACTIEQFVNYKGRQVPNSEVKFFKTAEEALKEVNKH